MNIILKNAELEAAIRQYILGQGVAFSGKSITSIKFSQTRQPAGFSAEVVLEDTTLAAAALSDSTAVQSVKTLNGAADVTSTALAVQTADAPASITNAVTEMAPAVTGTPADVDGGAKSVPEDAGKDETVAAAAESTESATEAAAPAADTAPAKASTSSLFS